MPKSLEIICTIDELRTKIASWRKDKLSIGLVPTMGSLHGGHLSLVARSVADNDRTCVTIFVNPRQFDLGEDFKAYPRDYQADTQALEDCKADLLFAPSVEEMYPTGSVTSVSVTGIGDILEGEFRPDFFKVSLLWLLSCFFKYLRIGSILGKRITNSFVLLNV